ncbi:MAG: hypothetical protein IJ679_01970 [Lachnospiraceae bacterium]|nr:hypothetical protein [Lachnospiraceae bacterium]
MKWMTKEDVVGLIDVDKLKGIFDEKVAVITGTTKKEERMKNLKKIAGTTLVVIAVTGCVCAIAYAIYKYLVPDYYDDDFDDEFEDDDFDDEDLFEIDDDDEEDEEEDDDEKKEAEEEKKD